MTVESVQIASLQHIIKTQDDILQTPDVDIVNVWRNESYRLTAANAAILEELAAWTNEERLRTATERRAIENAVRTASDSLANELDKRIKTAFSELDRRLSRIIRVVRTRIGKPEGIEIIALKQEKHSLELNLKALQLQIEGMAQESGLKNPISPSQCHQSTQTDTKHTQIIRYNPTRTEPDVRSMLAELKALELEAQALLMKR